MRVMLLKDLFTTLIVGGIAFLGYGLNLLIAQILNPAAAAISTAILFGVGLGFALWMMRRSRR